MTVSPARRSAFEILRRVESESAYASVLLASLPATMREDDRSLCHEIVLGVLRQRLWLDRSIEHFARRAIESLDLAVRQALELGLYQVRFLSRVPPSAAVNESVNLVRTARVKSAASFVNAVLRRATREPDFEPAANVADPIERAAIETSHPRWLIERWANAFGFDEAQSFARANNGAPPIAVRLTARALAGQQSLPRILDELTAASAQVVQSKIAPDAWRIVGAPGPVRRMAREGLIYVQDEASQLVAHLLEVGPGQRVLDVAAAPGSKASHIAALAPEAMVVAGDLYAHRIGTTRNLAGTQGAQINFLVHDAIRPLPFPSKTFARVLLDAPCSGTGTLRRNPEIRWRLKPEDITALSAQQLTMLSHAADMVQPGGRLIYSTCSVEIDENESVVNSFLANHGDFTRIRLEAARELQTENGELRTWPHRQGVDGFFVAAFGRGS